MPGRNEGELEVAMVERAAGIARIDLVHAAAGHIGGELVHGQELGVGLLADPHGVAGMVLMPMRERHMRHAVDRLVQGNPGILEGGVAGEERIDQDAARRPCRCGNRNGRTR